MKQPKLERGWRRWTEEEARAALDGLARSGESAETFARRQGISPQRLRYWRKRLAERATSAHPAFVALTLPAAPTPRPQVEVRIEGVVIVVHDGCDIEQVASLVSAIARRRLTC